MASSGGLTSFSFNSNTLSVTAGGSGQLTLALDSADLSAEAGRTVTFTSSDTSTATVAPGTATIQVATHSYSITVTGVSAGSATITAACTDSQGTAWTSTATVTVTNPTQVIVAEQSLQDIADAIRGKLGVNAAYKPADMASAIASISSGGGIDLSGFLGLTKAVTGSFRPSGAYYTDVTHNLGVLPKLAIYVLTDPTDLSGATSSSSQRAILGIKIQTGQFLEGTDRMESGIFVEAGLIGYNPSTYATTSPYGTFRSQSIPSGSNGYYQTSLYATSFRSSNFPLNAYKATETSITFYRGNNNAYFTTSATYNYLVAG